MESRKINPNIVPIEFPRRGKHPETCYQEDFNTLLTQHGIQRVEMPVVTNDFFSFDFLGLPEYSPVRSEQNVIRPTNITRPQDIPEDVIMAIKKLHQERFGVSPSPEGSLEPSLVSHTTAQLVENIFQHGLKEIYIISKTFREKKEKREKMQVEIALMDRSLPEIISFVQHLYSNLLHRPVDLNLISDFYYFLEPSFSFSSTIDDQLMNLGSAGFVRPDVMQELKKQHPESEVKNIAFVGIPYLKLLNLRLGHQFNDFDRDYNVN